MDYYQLLDMLQNQYLRRHGVLHRVPAHVPPAAIEAGIKSMADQGWAVAGVLMVGRVLELTFKRVRVE